MLKTIHIPEDSKAAEKKAKTVAMKLRGDEIVASGGKVETGIEETLIYMNSPGNAGLKSGLIMD